jgi:hypothetical protein
VVLSEGEAPVRSEWSMGQWDGHGVLMGRIEQRLRLSAGRLAATGRVGSAVMVEDFADTIRLDLERPAPSLSLLALAEELERTEEPSSACDSTWRR